MNSLSLTGTTIECIDWLHNSSNRFPPGGCHIPCNQAGMAIFFFLHPREGSICHFLLNFFLREGSICHFLLKGHLKGFGRIVRLKDMICIYYLPEAGDIVTVWFVFISHCAPVADPGFPVGGVWTSWGGCGPPRWLHFKNFDCQNEGIWTYQACARHTPPRSANVLI